MFSHAAGQRPRIGFTLVELMIALAVMVILAAIAWPSLQEAVLRSRRADGMSALANIMQAQERWRANHPAYQGVIASLPGARTTSADGHYDLSVAVETETERSAYTARATARSGSPQSNDGRCKVLLVEIDGGRITYSSIDSGGAANSAPDPCWAR